MTTLTKRQAEVLAYIRATIAEKQRPSYGGLAKFFGCSRTNVFLQVRALQKKGYVKIIDSERGRIELTGKAESAACVLCGAPILNDTTSRNGGPYTREEIEQYANRFGSSNCWTGTLGKACAMLRQLLARDIYRSEAGKIGGKARAKALSGQRRTEIARQAAFARWRKKANQ